MPWPISTRAMRTTTVSSGLITTQALISGVVGVCGGGFGREGDVEAEREAAGGGSAGGEEVAAGNRGCSCVSPAQPGMVEEASLIAALMRL